MHSSCGPKPLSTSEVLTACRSVTSASSSSDMCELTSQLKPYRVWGDLDRQAAFLARAQVEQFLNVLLHVGEGSALDRAEAERSRIQWV